MKPDGFLSCLYVAALLATSISSSKSQTNCVPALSGLLSWWRVEGSASDSIGNIHGTLYGGTTFAPGKVGQAFSFDGINDCVTNSMSGLTNILDSYTTEFWVWPTAGRASTPENTSGLDGDGNQRYAIFPHEGPTGGTVGSGISVGTNGVSVVEHGAGYLPALLVFNTPILGWTHIAVVYSNRRPSLYINGALVRSGLTSVNQSCPSTWLGERGAASVNQGFYAGLLDEVSIYGRSLSATEIQAIYVAGSAGKCAPSDQPPVIASHPTNQSVNVGGNASFSVTATGTAPLTYQWQFFGTNLSGATASSLTLTNVQVAQSGWYVVAVTNLGGWVVSSNAVLTVAVPPCSQAATGLVAWWRAEGNADEAAGIANGVLVNGAGFAQGRVDQAFIFDGINDHVRVPDRAGFHVTNALSIEAWVHPIAHGAFHTVVSKWDIVLGPNQKSYVLAVHSDGRFYLALCADGNDAVTGAAFSTNALPLNQWSHVCGTYDGGLIRVFLDGKLQAQTAYSAGVFPGTNDLSIGAQVGGGAFGQELYSFAGRIDEPALYNRALSVAEIKALYDAGGTGKCFVPSSPVIIGQPLGQTVVVSNNTTFQVFATGTSPLKYQWRLDGENLLGETNSILHLFEVQPSYAGAYSVAITNSAGFAISDNAFLEINALVILGNGNPLTNSSHAFGSPVLVELQSRYANGLVFYTLDGSSPSFRSTPYEGPFLVSENTTIRVIVYRADFFEAGEAGPVTILIPPSYTLNLSSGGGGTITANPPAGPYLSNTIVTLTATPNSGWTFLKLIGDASGENATTNITVTRAKSIQAIFGTTLSTTAAGGGSVALNPPGGVYPYGTAVQLSAIPSVGKYFALWGNAGSGNLNPLVFVLTNANPTVSSLFAAVNGGEAALTIVPLGLGHVTVSPRANVFATGTNATLTASPEMGQSFVGWSGDASGDQNPLLLALDTSKLIYANFTKRPQISVLNSGGIKSDGVSLLISGSPGDRYELVASTNLSIWTPLAILTNKFGTDTFTDTTATNASQMFYRLVIVP